MTRYYTRSLFSLPALRSFLVASPIKMRSLLAPFAVLVLTTGVTTAAEAQFTYTYQSRNYNVFAASDPSWTYTPDQSFRFSIDLSAPMAANSFVDLFKTTVSWAASDGKYTFGGTGLVGFLGPDSYNPAQVTAILGAQFQTDAAGRPVGWSFSLYNGAGSGQLYAQSPTTIGEVSGVPVYDYVYSQRAGDIEKAGTALPGTWTETPDFVTTPEPASLVLLGSGLAGLAVVGRRRRGQ